MTTKTGISRRIAAYVAAHPGCMRRELMAALGVTDPSWSMPTYCAKAGLIHAAGPRCSLRYYPSAHQAQSADAAIRAEVSRRRAHRVLKNGLLDNLRRRIARRDRGSRQLPTMHRIQLPPDAVLAPDVRITIAPALRGRWE